MILEHNIPVQMPADEIYERVSDLGQIAQAVPGAHLDEIEADHAKGRIEIKVGPVRVNYAGEAHVAERHSGERRLMFTAEALDTSGRGGMQAKFSLLVEAVGEQESIVHLKTDLQLNGPAAQVGGPAIRSVAGRLLERLVNNLLAELGDEDVQPGGAAAENAAGAKSSQSSPTFTRESWRKPLVPGAHEVNPIHALLFFSVAVLAYMIGRRRKASSGNDGINIFLSPNSLAERDEPVLIEFLFLRKN